MQPKETYLTDYMRILLGDVPWPFLIECMIRIFFLYFLIVIAMRLMGKRIASTISRSDVAAIASIAGATGVPMQGPDQGLLPTFVAALVVVGVQRSVGYWSVHNEKFDETLNGRYYTMASEGRLVLENMSKSVLTKERLFSQLRTSKIDNLGRVERMYMEANGSFTMLQYPEPRAGLSLAPSFDQEYIDQQVKAPGVYACSGCGCLKHQASMPASPCTCGCNKWVPAVLS